jgi:hypothetical protein
VIISNRRLRLLYLSLAGMDMAVLLPWLTNLVMLWARNGDVHALRLQTMLTQSPLLLFIIFWLTMQFYMLLSDLLNEWEIPAGLHPFAVLGVLTVTSLLAVRFLLYPTLPPGDFRWLRETLLSVVNLVAGVRGELLLIVVNYFLWLRVARYTDRSLSFFAVGVSFRLGMLLVIVGSAMLSYRSGEYNSALIYLILFFAFGLCAVALARIDQKAVGASNSSGALLPWNRFVQLWLVIISVLGLALTAATFYTPPILRTVLGWFAPLGQLVQWIFTGLTFLAFLILTPFLEWLTRQLQEMMAEAEPMEMGGELTPPDPLTFGDAVREFAALRYCITAAIIFAALIILVVMFVRVVRRRRKFEGEEGEIEGGVRPGGFTLGLDRLKDWFALLSRYGLGSQLLAAISVENIYANLSRLARRKGFPRQPAQGPDRYLPVLMQAFPHHEAELNAITTAYMRVRYAERPITAQELEELRAAYTTITEADEAEGKNTRPRPAT